MAASSRAQVLDLYRAMLRESKHFSAYNYRNLVVTGYHVPKPENPASIIMSHENKACLASNMSASTVSVEFKTSHFLLSQPDTVIMAVAENMLSEDQESSALFEMYAVRRIRDAFRENKNVKDPVEIQALVNKAKRDLEIIRRQVHIGQLYSTDKLIIENQEKPRT